MKTTAFFLLLPVLIATGCDAGEGEGDLEFRSGSSGGPTAEGDVKILHPGAFDANGDGEGDGDCGEEADPDDDEDCDLWDVNDGAIVWEKDRSLGKILLKLTPPQIRDKNNKVLCMVQSNVLWAVTGVFAGNGTNGGTLTPLFYSNSNKIYAWGDFINPVLFYQGKKVFEGPIVDNTLAALGTANIETASTFRKLLIAGLISGVCGSPGI